jgi:uncharacterized protein YbaP (TraB family)
MLTIYKTQQLEDIEGLFAKSEFGEEKNQAILLDNRNKNWISQLKKLPSTQSRFIAVGAGHLVGKMGLISLLRKEGYTVRAIDNK